MHVHIFAEVGVCPFPLQSSPSKGPRDHTFKTILSSEDSETGETELKLFRGPVYLLLSAAPLDKCSGIVRDNAFLEINAGALCWCNEGCHQVSQRSHISITTCQINLDGIMVKKKTIARKCFFPQFLLQFLFSMQIAFRSTPFLGREFHQQDQQECWYSAGPEIWQKQPNSNRVGVHQLNFEENPQEPRNTTFKTAIAPLPSKSFLEL